MNRRKFVQFIGTMAAGSFLSTKVHSGPSHTVTRKLASPELIPLSPTSTDTVILAKGFEYKKLISWNDRISKNKDLKFGFNNDFIAFLNLEQNKIPMTATLWVNHESSSTFFVGEQKINEPRSKSQAIKELASVGGSALRIYRTPQSQLWNVDFDSEDNFRIDGRSCIPFSGNTQILGRSYANGTIGNCAGGQTNWGTVLSCEENFEDSYGDFQLDKKGQRKKIYDSTYAYDRFFDDPSEHYGWVVEVDVRKKSAVKLVALGRYSHECATTTLAKDGRTVVYSGDDAENECLYKFISSQPNSLETGELFVADLKRGRWISLNYSRHEGLKKFFRNQLEVQIYTRQAAKIVGGSQLDRPEDIEIHPLTGDIFVSLTNNIPKNNYHGSILKITEKNNDPLSMEFTSSLFAVGGTRSGFACPDNFVFDRNGGLWMTSDISESDIGTNQYKNFGNNGLYYIPTVGKNAGRCYQVASAPMDAEFTGPCFSHDQKTLFLSVQHPGCRTKLNGGVLTSHWPDGGNSIPKPSVIQIYGPMLESLTKSVNSV